VIAFWEETHMHKSLFIATSALALAATSALADGHLLFAPGEGDFSWDSLTEFAANQPNLSGHTVTIAGPWL
jgi:alpha-glucoside transport system substrate-binding protein